MRFDLELAVVEAVGAILAHGQRLGPGGGMLKKGHVVTEADVTALRAAGATHVAAVRLDEGDVDEDEAAARIAAAITGPHLTVARATTGRANVFAAARGVLVVERERLDALNVVDEAITVATVAPCSVVEVGAMVATVKIIPFAVPAALVERAANAASSGAGPLLGLAPFVKKRAGLVLTTLPGIRAEVLTRSAENQRRRLQYVGGEIARELRVHHDVASVARAIAELVAGGLDLVLVLGASAIVDRRDVVPAAIEAIGGAIDHLGMPVDPGNLLLLGRHGRVPIVGVPGCARSLKPSGFDDVLERLAADLPVTGRDLMLLGAGGLLAEVASRPSPRQPESRAPPRVAAVVLAAGFSRRMGGTNKLLAPLGGVPIVVRVVDALLASNAVKPLLVVVGHEADHVRAALRGRDVDFVENAAYDEGLGASLRAGIEDLCARIDTGERAEVDGTLVALGDMPWIRSTHVDALIAAFDPAGPQTICVPVHDRKRGHPVLWSARHFAEMRMLGGDVGARALLEKHARAVQTVEVDDAAVHLDIDTPEMLAEARSPDADEARDRSMPL